ncbi:YraN family protein [Nocardioides insulae]|uniref:YraN family protein n=1 Tax=Nocardioides insulae TaxID=394734 RepID=UPI00040630B9|nr:YraN family protein [Nocardioides insulae]
MTTTTSGQASRLRALGEYGERVAERHLCEQGLIPLDHNWRCTDGEIDLVLRDGDTLVVCEVKTRSSEQAGTPHEAVDADKLDRLRRLAQRWSEDHDLRPPAVRIDLVAVVRPPRGPARVEHVRGLV